MSLLKGILDFDEVHVALERVGDFLVVWVIFEPLVHVVESVLFSQLVSEANTEGQKTIKVVRILLMSFFESQNSVLVLV